MKAVKVARVSTAEQKEAGNSLPAQLDRIESYCQRKGYEIIKSFSFDESAYKEKRDEFDKLLEYVQDVSKKEKVAVCFDKVDRLSRSVFDKRVGTLYEMAVADLIELHFVSDGQVINNQMSAVEKFQFGMSLGLAKYYSDAISDNTKRVFELKRKNGEWNGKPRIGYINTTLENGKKEIIPDPDRAHLVQKLFELYSTGGYSITALWQEMTKLGLRGMNGQKLARSNIELILRDTFYYGMARSKKYGLYPHHYQPLITRALFDKCQEVRAGRSNKKSKEISRPYIFKGLLPCKDCGCLYSPDMKTKKSGLQFIYYSCTNAKGICKRTYVSEKDLLKPIREVFERFRGIPQEVQDRLVTELRALNEGEIEFHQRQIKRIRNEYDRVQKMVDTLLDMRLDQSITPNEYDKKLPELKDKQYRLNIELEEHTKADHQYHISVNMVLNLSRRIGDIFESSEVNEKRAILAFVLQNPTVSGKNIDFVLRKPFDAVLELASCPTGLRRLYDVRTYGAGR